MDLQQDAFECWGIAERERLRQISLKALSICQPENALKSLMPPWREAESCPP